MTRLRCSIVEAIGFMALSLVAIACTSPFITVSSRSQSTVLPPPANGHLAHMGDTLALSDQFGEHLSATVLGVVDPAPVALDPSPNPAALDPGQQAAAVQIRVSNPSTVASVRTDLWVEMTVIDAKSQAYSPWLPVQTTAGAAFPSGDTLSPGSTVVGYVGFRVPVGTVITRVKYAPSSDFAKKAGEWLAS